jgi:hypothetical protein
MAFEGFDFILKLVLVVNLPAVEVLKLLDLSLECSDLILSQLKSNLAIILQVDKLFASEEFLIVHLC